MPAFDAPPTSLIPSVGLRFRLTRAWGRVLVVGWTALSLTIVCVAASSQIIGRPVWWLDDQRFATTTLALWLIAVFALPFGIVVWSLFSGPFAPHLSLVATVELAVLALSDRHSSPGSAVVLAAISSAALLLSVASFAGLHRRVEPGTETRDEGQLVPDLGAGTGSV